MQGAVLARLTGCNIAGLNFFVRSQAVSAKAISRIYAKTTAAPARGACRPIRMRTCKVTSSLIADLAEPIFLEGYARNAVSNSETTQRSTNWFIRSVCAKKCL